MSLKEAAQYLQSQGRGNDSRLMHVSPRELQSLQTLAKAKGGSLTINPNTGLPEAGLLEDMSPLLPLNEVEEAMITGIKQQSKQTIR
jgi:hypothetical protein